MRDVVGMLDVRSLANCLSNCPRLFLKLRVVADPWSLKGPC
jgi:hypothetical protein